MPLTDDLCPLGFAPHSVRPTRCKRCFRDYEDHKPKKPKDDPLKKKRNEANTPETNESKVDTKKSSENKTESKDDTSVSTTATIVRRRRDKEPVAEEPTISETVTIRRNRSRPHSIASFDENSLPQEKLPSPKASPSSTRRNSATTSSGGEEHERRRSRYVQILSAQEVTPEGPPGENSDELTSPDVAFILQVKTSTSRFRDGNDEDTVSVAPTDTTETTLTMGDTLEDLQSQIQSLKSQLEVSEAKTIQLEKEAKEWQENKYHEVDKEELERTANELLILRSKVREVESINEELKDENKVLKLEAKELQEDLDRRPSPEEVERTIAELRNKLIVAESLYEELLDENEDFKREIRDLEDEIEELQDNFREDQADEYGILKKELEQTAKNCRILQFKLRKAEKRCDQLDTDKTQYEGKLKELIKSGHLDVNQTEKLNQMELELSVARETSNRMHSEMESLQSKFRQLQEEKDNLSKKKASEGGGVSEVTHNRVPSPVARRELKPEIDSRFKDVSLELDSAQLLRDLYDTMERENDLKEQLRFTEEEAENFRKKMSFLEQENETLALQIKKMATKRSKDGRQRPPSREGNYDDDSGISDDTEDLTPSELKLQLELNEQETSVLRRKVEDLEVENISLQKQVRELQDKVEEKPSTIDLPSHPPADPAQANIFYEQKVKVLETEAKELRMKIIDKDRENERLSNEIMLKQRKGSKTMMTRSRSLDSDMQIDLKRQLQLVEQEAAILRQRTSELESENDSLISENKTLQIRAAKKLTLTPQEKLLAENMRLQTKIEKLEKKLSEEKELSSGSATNANDIGSMESLRKQLKQQEIEINSLNVKMESLKSENNSLNAQIKTLSNKTLPGTTKRKKIPDFAPKQEFKKAVEELEVEVGQLQTNVHGKTEENKSLSAEIQEKTKMIQQLQNESKKNEEKFQTQLAQVNKTNETLTKSLENEKKKLETLSTSLKELENEKNKAMDKDEVTKYTKQIESLQKELDEERLKAKRSVLKSASASPNTVSFEDMRKVEEEKHKLQKQILDYQRKISDSDKKIADLEQTTKEGDKIQRQLRHQIDDLNEELDKEKNNLKKVDNRQTEVAMGWLKEREEMKKQLTDLNKKSEQLTKDVSAKDKKINELDEKILDLNKKRDATHTSLKQREEELKNVKENNSKLKTKLKELEEKFAKVDRDMEDLTDKWKKLDLLYKKEKDDWVSKQSDYELQDSTSARKIERMEKEYEMQLRDRDEEVIRLKEKLRKMDLDKKSKTFIEEDKSNKADLENKLKEVEAELVQEKQEYEDLTTKYEMLEEEHVVTKARLVMEKEEIETQLKASQKEIDQLSGELKTLRETFNMRQDTWICEKLDLQEKIKVIEDRFSRLGGNLDEEVLRLKEVVDEKNKRIEQYKKDDRQLREDVDKLKRLTQDLRSKLNDFERGHTSGRYGSDLTPSSKKELQELQNNLMQAEVEELRKKLNQEEKVHRSEVTALKMMNDVKIAQMQDEIQMLHIQVGKFRRERDTFKEMLEGAQRTIGDLKTDSIRRRDSYVEHETEELKDKLQNLRKVVSTLQDQLDQSERANSHLKTEYVTEKASWEIKVAEMQTKVNELEESTILQGGKSKIVGVKTKLELAWQKEREEQQRLLHESHRMAKELRQRVIDLENARDKERNEAKSQLEDLRKTVEADQAETQIKISELQADLLELRDAHSKMRTINDRIKRDRDKMERDKDELRMKLNQTQQFQADELASITGLVAELEKLKKLVPTILDERPTTPTKAKPQVDTATFLRTKDEFKTTLLKISRATEELRRAHGVREEERVKRNLSFRRALSATESDLEAKPPTAPSRSHKDDPLSRWQNPQRVTAYPQSPPSMVISPPRQAAHSNLHRKSLSLDQTLTWEELEQSIWKSESEAGSSTSLQETEIVHKRSRSSGAEYSSLNVPESGPSPLPRRKRRTQTSLTSLDSVSSSRDGSIDKDERTLPPRPPSPNLDGNKELASMTLPKVSKDKRPTSGSTVKDKFRMFGKSKSTESPDSLASGSDVDIHKEDKPKDFRSKISNIFRKSPANSFDSDKSAPGSSVNSTLSDKLKSLKPVSASDSKQKTQYRSTGALHTKAINDPSLIPNSTSSLPRRLFKKFNTKSSVDNTTESPPASNSSTLKTHHETPV